VSGHDLCKGFKSRHRRKGDINWPTTGVGSRSIVRCPYGYDQTSYAHRDCTLSMADPSQTSKWSQPNVTMCPYSPFSKGVDRLAGFVVSLTHVCHSLYVCMLSYMSSFIISKKYDFF